MKKVKMFLKRLKFKYKVRKIMRSRKVKSLNTLVVTHADRQIGKTTYLVELVNKDESGVLVVSSEQLKKHVKQNFPWVEVYTALELIRYRREYSRLHLNLYIDETVLQSEVEALMPYYTIKIFLQYKHVNY